MRRRITLGLLALSVALVGHTSMVQPAAAVRSVESPPRAGELGVQSDNGDPRRLASKKAPCEDVVWVGARGSGEPFDGPELGMGTPVNVAFAGWRAKVSERRFVYWPVDYPATAVTAALTTKFGRREYFEGLDKGIRQTLKLLKARSGMCPKEKYVLAGYSQGAMVMHRSMFELARLGTVPAARILGFILIADGDQMPGQKSFDLGSAGKSRGVAWINPGIAGAKYKPVPGPVPAKYRDRTITVCEENDIVCDPEDFQRPLADKRLAIHTGSYHKSEHGNVAHKAGRILGERAMVKTVSTPGMHVVNPSPAPIAVGEEYGWKFRATGGAGPYTFKYAGFAFFNGYSLSKGGRFSGRNDEFDFDGEMSFTLQVTDANGQAISQPVKIPVLDSGATIRVSVASDGTQTNWSARSHNPVISDDGRYVAFDSESSTLVPGDTNNQTDVFLRDLNTGTTTRISKASDGTQANGGAETPAISGDGRYIAYYSGASNLVSGDTDGHGDIFVHDRVGGATTRISVASDGTQANSSAEFYDVSISGDGRYVAYSSEASNLVTGDTNNWNDVFVRDRVAGTTARVSVASDGTEANHRSFGPAISGDGRYITYYSEASNLVSGDTNGRPDVFIYDQAAGTTDRLSVASDGTQGDGLSINAEISADGRYVVYASKASNLVPGDTNNWNDVFVRDRSSNTTTRVSVSSDGIQSDKDDYYQPSISSDGRYITYESEASNLVPGDTNNWSDVFLYDRTVGTTTRISTGIHGAQPNEKSSSPVINGDGRYIAYDSYASNLVPGDTNHAWDIFLWRRPD